jgi:uncharacterized protein
MKNIRDTIHGDLPFTALELKLMDTRVMQRLRGIKQLGTSYLVYPGAIHTRFEHSLGTCFMAKQILEHLKKQTNFSIRDHDEKAIPAAALLHDVTHIPFGHTLEDERRIFPRHDMDPERLQHFVGEGEIGAILKKEKILYRVMELLQKNSQTCGDDDAYCHQIISHTICADLLDYLRRDARFCGLKLDYDDRLFRYFQVENGNLIVNLQKDGLFRHDAFSEIIHLLRIRYFLTERVYYHHAKIAGGAMLSRAVEQAVISGFKVEKLFALRDDGLLYLLEEQFAQDPLISRLMSKFLSRHLYKRCYVLTDHNLSIQQRNSIAEKFHANVKGDRARVENRIAKLAKIPREAVIIYAPPPSMNLKEADVLVKVSMDNACPLGMLGNKEVASLQEKFGKLWKFYVFLDPEYGLRFNAAATACEEILGLPNELPLIKKGQLSLFPGTI